MLKSESRCYNLDTFPIYNHRVPQVNSIIQCQPIRRSTTLVCAFQTITTNKKENQVREIIQHSPCPYSTHNTKLNAAVSTGTLLNAQAIVPQRKW